MRGSGRLIQEEMEERLAATSEMLVRLRSSYQVEITLAKKYGVERRAVRRWMKTVRDRRKALRSQQDQEESRDDVRETINTILALCLQKSQVVKNGDGSVVMTKTTMPDGRVIEHPTTRANPDVAHALHAVRELIHLDGLNKPVKAAITVDGELGVMPDLKNLKPQAVEAMEGLLKALSPDGDLGKLAGDWFKFSGETAPKP